MRPIVLCILDGVGWGRRDDGDAVAMAHTPVLDQLMHEHSWTLLKAHGTAVGMPSDGDMGNSEVGHNAMGAGRIFSQGAKLVQNAIHSGQIWGSAAWQKAITANTLHIMGLLSDGNVHSHIDHFTAIITQAAQEGVQHLRVHLLTDGRDVDPRSALTYIEHLEEVLAGVDADYCIATGGGRMHMTMDRYEADWDMVKRGWDTHVHGQGQRFSSAAEAVKHFYEEFPEMDDQWLPGFVVGEFKQINDGDAVLFMNFRGDRAIEISRAFEEETLSTFDRGKRPDVFFAGMMEYDGDLKVPKQYLVPPPEINDTVGDRMSAAGLSVLSVSETQKFGHVTFFFNGNRSGALPHEDQQELPSANVPFDQLPEMSASAITDAVVKALHTQKYQHIRLNLANGDMVGHTGDFDATVKAIEFLDQCLEKITTAALENNAVLLVTADHGNADEMAQIDKKSKGYKCDANGKRVPSTSHSKNPVPFLLIDPQQEWSLKGQAAEVSGGIAQIGGTLLHACGLEVPNHYLPSLIEKRNA